MDHVGKEVVREGLCKEHQSWSASYEGVVGGRWLFRCNGKGAQGRTSGSPHRFTAAP